MTAMTPVRTKDKIFLALVLPLAAAGAYWYFWRAEAAARLDRLEAEHEALVAVEDYPMEKRRAENRLADAQAALEREKAMPLPAAKMKAEEDASVADRARAVLDVFREHGIVVLRSELVEDATQNQECREAIWKAALWKRGWRAKLHRYTLDGPYPAVKRALDAFCDKQMAVIVEKTSMAPGASARWVLEVWL